MGSNQSAATASNQPAAEPSAWWIALGGLLAGCLSSVLIERRAARVLAHERRRVAADVHDLVMQDLSLALANARTLAGEEDGAPRADLIVSASERALAGARVVVGTLTKAPARDSLPMRGSEPLVRAIEASAQAAARSTPLIFDANGVPRSARPDRPTREALVHIAREAVTNATKHACSNAIEVTLQYTGQWRLTVRDEGNGFDLESNSLRPEHTGFDKKSNSLRPEHTGLDMESLGFDAERNGNGFGLTSMRAHVHALGGALHISSGAQRGTTVEAVLP